MNELKNYPMSEYDLKVFELGKRAKVLLDLHIENPKRFNADAILDHLFMEYEKHKFDLEEKG
jgi:hypothetical protein